MQHTQINHLDELQTYIQSLFENLHSLMDLEMSLVTKDYTILAATEKSRHRIGEKSVPHIYDHLFYNKQIRIIDNPRYNGICSDCKNKPSCKELVGINIPIMLDKNPIGAISLSAKNSKQSSSIINNRTEYTEFGVKVADLIKEKLEKYYLIDNVSFLTHKLNKLIGMADKGIILLDDDGYINNVNDIACSILNLESNGIIGRKVEDIFSADTINKNILKQLPFTYCKNMSRTNSHSIQIIESGAPITLNNIPKGYIWVINKTLNIDRTQFRDYTLSNLTFNNIIGQSGIINNIKRQAAVFAESDSNIMIYGENGTGKELFARAIHNCSSKRDGPFIPINCGAIPENLIESELFGYEEGSFTGAKKRGKPGKFELANNGTIFLDEIGELPLQQQAKLLRVVENRAIFRLGGSKEIPINARIISATNRDLDKMVMENSFREDLYFRLNVLPLYIPPLRERGEKDIVLLIETFTKKWGDILGKEYISLSKEALNMLTKYLWPGNIRELENAIEYAVTLDKDGVICCDDLPNKLNSNCRTYYPVKNIEGVQRDEIIKAIEHYGNGLKGKHKAAKALGISISTLYRWIKKYNINL